MAWHGHGHWHGCGYGYGHVMGMDMRVGMNMDIDEDMGIPVLPKRPFEILSCPRNLFKLLDLGCQISDRDKKFNPKSGIM
jgi:hypothetical protein